MKVKVELQNRVGGELPNQKVLTQIAKWTLEELNQIDANIYVTAFYVDDKQIREVNKQYRNKDKATDVISFRMIDNPRFLMLNKQNFPLEYDGNLHAIYLGEIFICKQVADAQAPEYGNTLNREIAELFCHGMFHILGFDHETEKDRKVMKKHEEAVCKKIEGLVK